jgi:membrane fusion protein (multidrug efflux system)
MAIYTHLKTELIFNKRILSGTFLVFTVLSGMFLTSCKQDSAPASTAIPVNLIVAKSRTVVYYDRYTATTVALNQVDLRPEVQGYITGLFFKEGSSVKRGQKLFEIDKRIYENAYHSAAANLKVAEGNLKQAQQDADRYEFLNKNQAVAKQIYDHAMITLENAKNAYNAASEALKTAKTNLNYSVITAPFDGTVGFSMVKRGDLVTAGQTVLLTISADDPMGVDFLINEKQLPYFENIQNNSAHPVDSLFSLILPDNSLYPFLGKISVIDRAVNPQTGSIRIRLVFPNPKHYLRAGMSLVLQVHNLDSKPQLVIPNIAAVEEMGEYFVYLAKDSVAGNQGKKSFAFQTKVKLGQAVGSDIIVLSGIKEGDKVVVDGVQSLHNGSQISLSGKRSGGGKK